MAMQYLPVACFGKLPFWPEYLEADLSFPSSRALKQWFHRGNERAGMESDDGTPKDVRILSHLRFLLSLPGSTELLAGVLRPSHDRGGRHFPFAVFTHFPRKHYGKHYHLLPLALAPVWEMLDDAWDSLHSATEKGGFDEMLSSLEVRGPAPVAEVRGAYQGLQQDGADRLFRGGDGSSWEALERNLPQVMGRLRKAGADNAVSVGMPASGDLDEAAFDASFWIDLVNRHFFMRRLEPSVFLDEKPGAETRQVLLSYGMISADDYPEMMGIGGGARRVIRPAHTLDGSESAEPAPPPGLSYAEMLKKRFPAK